MKKVCYLILLLQCLFFAKAKATHVMGAEIHWKSLGYDTFEVSTVIYRRCTDGASSLSPATLTFASDSCSYSYGGTISNPFSHTIEDITPVCPGTNLPCGSSNTSSNASMPAGVEKHIYKYKVYLGGNLNNCCWYKFTWEQCCRASNITTGYADADFTTTSWLNRCLAAGDESPKFAKKPFIFICYGLDNAFDCSATDADGDSLSYKLAIPGGGSYTSPWSYTYPLTCLGGNSPNPNNNPPLGFNFNNTTGMMLFRAMQVQCTVIKIEITEWRVISGVKKVIGKTSRDLQVFTIAGCSPILPTLPGPFTYETCVNHKICVPIYSSINNAYDSVKVSLSTSLPPGSTVVYNNDVRLGYATLCWTPDTASASSLPYYFTATALSAHCSSGNFLLGSTTRSFSILARTNVVSTYTKKKLNCRDYDFVGIINSSSNNPNAKSIRWYINNVLVNGATKVYTGDSLRYRFHQYGIYAIRMEMDAGGSCAETKYDTIQIDTVNFLKMSISNDTLICSGDTATLKVLSITNGTTPFKYKWFINNTVVDTTASFKVSPAVPTWYRCELTTSDSCTDLAVDSVLIKPSPYLTPIPDQLICIGDSVYLKNIETANSCTWYFNGTSFSNQNIINVKDTGIYVLKVTAGNCAFYDTVVVAFYPPTFHNLLRDTFVCYPGGTVILNTLNNFSNYSYTWYRHDTVFSILKNPVITDSGTVRVVIKNNASGCLRYDTVFIGRKPFPDIPSPLTNKLICVNDSVLLTINDTSTTNSYLWKWNNYNFSSQKNIYAKLDGIYTLTVTSQFGCSAVTSDTVRYSIPTHTKLNNASICAGDSVQLLNTDSSSYSYAWYFNNSFISSNQNIYVKNIGTYLQKITNPFGCFIWDSVIVTQNPPPVHTHITDMGICPGDTAYITNTDTATTYTYAWYKYNNGSGNISLGNTKSIKVVDSGMYFVKIITSKGCVGGDTLKVIIYPGVNHTKISNKLICQTDSAYLQNIDTSSTYTYKWYFGATLISTAKSIYRKDTGRYVQRIQNSYGCVWYDTLRVDYKKYIYHTFLPDYTICNGETQHIINNDTCVYTPLWQLNGNFFSNSKNIDITSGGLYIFYMTNSDGCTLTDSVKLTVLTLPTHTKLTDKTICTGDSAFLQNTDSTQYTFQWTFNGNVISSLRSIYVKTPGWYYQKITRSNGCVVKDSVKVTVNLTPTHTALADMLICSGDSVITQVTDSSQYLFSWFKNGNLISNQRNIYVQTAGIYVIKIASILNCFVLDTFEVFLTNKPYHIAIPDMEFCEGDSAYLQNSYVSTNIYKWYLNGNLISTQKNIYSSVPGEYILKIESPSGCTLFDTIEVFRRSRPIHSKLTNQNICVYDSAYLENKDSANYTIAWYNNGNLISTQKSIYVSTSGIYINKITNPAGCMVYDTVVVNHYPPLIHNNIADTKVCLNDSVLLQNTDSANYSVVWYYNGSLISTQKNVYVKNAGIYINKTTSIYGCVFLDTINVSYYPFVIHNAIPDRQFCAGDSVQLKNTDSANYSVEWYFNGGLISTQKNIYIKNPGIYINKISNAFGCHVFDSIVINNYAMPLHNAIPDKQFCQNDSVLLQNTDSINYSVKWFYNGSLLSSQKSLYTAKAGVYVNRVTNSAGCFILDTFILTHFLNFPQHYPVLDRSFCEGDSAWLFNVDSSTYVYTWYFGGNMISTSRNIYVTVPGQYIVKVENSGPCAVYDTAEVTKYPKPVFSVTPLNPTVKKGNSINISASDTSFTYQWIGDSIITNWGDSVKLKPSKNSSYKVIAHTPNNCTDSLTFTVTVDASGIKNTKTRNSISIFPNPANKELQLYKDFTDETMITISDNIGKILLVKSWAELKTVIDISQYAEGVYTLSVSNKEFQEYFKFIKVTE